MLVESLREGIDGLRFSAEVAVGESAEDAAEGKPAGRWTANIAMILGFAFAIFLFKGLPHGASILVGLEPTQTLFHVVDGVVKLALVVAYIAAISRMKDIQRVFEYHGAEHKSIRTFEERAPLTVESAQGFSRLHERCGTSFIVVVVLASVFVYMAASLLIPSGMEGGWLFQLGLIGAKLLLLAPVAAIAYEVNRWAGANWRRLPAKVVAWPGLLMQRLLTTREPAGDQLEVALTALRAALAHGPEAVPASGEADWRIRRFAGYEAFLEDIEAEPIYTPEQSEAA